MSYVFELLHTTKPEGHGFSASTVYAIVEQTGGHIWLYRAWARHLVQGVPATRVREDRGDAPTGRRCGVSLAPDDPLVEDEDAVRSPLARRQRATESLK
jgi:hypothetical protein